MGQYNSLVEYCGSHTASSSCFVYYHYLSAMLINAFSFSYFRKGLTLPPPPPEPDLAN